jgi:hypothetical protein
VHTRIILGFIEKYSNTSKELYALSTYKMQVVVEKKKT